MLEGFMPKTSSSENTALKLPPPTLPITSSSPDDTISEIVSLHDDQAQLDSLDKTFNHSFSKPQLSPTVSLHDITNHKPNTGDLLAIQHNISEHILSPVPSAVASRKSSISSMGISQSNSIQPIITAITNTSTPIPTSTITTATADVNNNISSTNTSACSTPKLTSTPSSFSDSLSNFNSQLSENEAPTSTVTQFKSKIGKLGVCAMDAKVLSKPCRRILNRLMEHGEFETIIFGDKVILDENIENWPTCDFLISFFSNGFPLDKAIKYVKLRKPYILNDLVMQKVLWDRRLCLRLLEKGNIPTPERLEISRDGGPNVTDPDLSEKLLELGVDLAQTTKEPSWKMLNDDTLEVDGKTMVKPFVEKPVDGEDHNVYIYYHSKNGGGGRRLFRKVGNKSSEFDPNLTFIRTEGSYIYEKFMDADNCEDVKAYTVGENYCHAETRKSPVVDGIVRRNTHGKEIRYITKLTDEERQMAGRVSKVFQQTICGFDLLRVHGHSYVIDVNGFSFVKDNNEYYDNCAKILRDLFIEAKKKMNLEKRKLPAIQEEKTQKWVFKGLVTVIRHADRTPKQKFKYSFTSPIFISLLKGHKEEVIIRNVNDLHIVLQALKIARQENLEDSTKLDVLTNALEKKIDFPGTKIQLKPVLNKETKNVEKVQFILKWGGEPTHSAKYQATELGEQMRQDFDLLNKSILNNITIYSSSERRVLYSAQLWASALFGQKLDDENNKKVDEILIRKDLLDDSNAAKELMDKVKKKLKPLLRMGAEAPPQFTWPPKMPEPYLVIKRVCKLMNYHKKIMEHNFATKDVNHMQARWCCGEDPMLFKERWDKLFKEFVNVEKADPSKISELYDTMKYDALHNREFLENIFSADDQDYDENLVTSSLVDRYPINILARNNFKITNEDNTGGNTIVPKTSRSVSMTSNTSSVTSVTASSIGSNTPTTPTNTAKSNSVGSLGWVLESGHNPVRKPTSAFDGPKFIQLRELYRLSKVLFDFICPQEYGIEDGEKLDIGLLTSLPLAKQILNDIDAMKSKDEPACVAYFTKESHIYTLLNILYESGIPMRIARNALPELDYLSQINFELYESLDKITGKKSHAIRLKLSPGCHTQDPLDVQLDEKHYISCIPKISLTKHLDADYVTQKLRRKFTRVRMPQKFTPVNITSPNLSFKKYSGTIKSLEDETKEKQQKL
ncbi:probable Inositol hexakisphosphate and diphosphoinositol-pentakisphosphate kinase [Saccharomycodes ludwigii]|uniref:Inositol hexakisphosphate and diphosphoinositol-pentakisphosphate kinase n=2 Tax=Saccharomycodes ludwigii TaxID=36035 RepID=A0A376BB41_9ASCO|nr:probable Inositol hexakisphosphate and diphosphoinositol-pentakisphosphate kinase [Saccharomycodes ludwigii]